MTILRVERWLIGAALVAAGLAGSGLARAEGPASDAPAAGAPTKKDAPASDEAKKEEEAPLFDLGVDAVFGSASTAEWAQITPGGASGGTNPVVEAGHARVTSQSFIIEGAWDVTERFRVGGRVPIVSGEIESSAYSRGSLGLGNIELGGDGEISLTRGVDLTLGLGVALPTASGSSNQSIVAGTIDQSALDRYSIQRAVSMARGYEDDALFTPTYLGIIPKVGLHISQDRWHLDPWVKMENMIADKTVAGQDSYIGDLVFGANFGFLATKNFEPALRVWAAAPISGADFNTVAVVEPQLRFHFGDFTPVVGAILPFAGDSLTSPYAGGVRLALAGRF